MWFDFPSLLASLLWVGFSRSLFEVTAPCGEINAFTWHFDATIGNGNAPWKLKTSGSQYCHIGAQQCRWDGFFLHFGSRKGLKLPRPADIGTSTTQMLDDLRVFIGSPVTWYHVSCAFKSYRYNLEADNLCYNTYCRTFALRSALFWNSSWCVLCRYLGPLLRCSPVQSVQSAFFPCLWRTWTRWWSSWNPCRWNATRCWMTPRHQRVLSLWLWYVVVVWAPVLWGCDRSSFLRLTRETSWDWDGQGKGGRVLFFLILGRVKDSHRRLVRMN